MTKPTFPADWDGHRDLLVVVGDGCGPLVRDLRARGQRRIYVVSERTPDDLPDDVPWVASPPEILMPVVATPGLAPERVVVHCTADPWADSARRDETVHATREAVRSRAAQRITLARSGATWLKQGLENLRSVAAHPAVPTLYGRFRGRTAFVCAPGPSLSPAIPFLRDRREECLVIAVSHALHSLLDNGVTPDFVVAADPGNLDRHFAGLDTSEVGALVIALTCRATLFDQPARSHFHFAGNGRIDDWLYQALGVDARLPSGGSVSCSAASLALHLGCERVVFCGLDLSFPGGRYYARETLDGDARVEETGGKFFLRKEAGAEGSSYRLADGGLRFSADQPVVQVPSATGGTVPTSPAMRVYLSWFEAIAEELGDAATLVQTSPDGARIRGFAHHGIAAEFERVHAPTPRVDDVVRAAQAAHDPVAARDALTRTFERVRDVLPQVAGLARDLSTLAGRAAHDPQALSTLQAGERELRSVLQALPLLTLIAQGDLERAEEEARQGADLAANLRASRRIYAAVERAARLALPFVESGLAPLEDVREDAQAA